MWQLCEVDQNQGAIAAAVAKFGPRVVSHRLREFIQDDRYKDPERLTNIITLLSDFCIEKEVSPQLLHDGVHVALVRRAWSALKTDAYGVGRKTSGLCLLGLDRYANT